MFNPDREPKKENRLEKIELTNEERKLVELIMKKGINDAEVIQKLGDLQSEDKEEEIKSMPIPDLAQIDLHRRIGYIFLAARMLNQALEKFNDGLEIASCIVAGGICKPEWRDIEKEIEDEIKKIEWFFMLYNKQKMD